MDKARSISRQCSFGLWLFIASALVAGALDKQPTGWLSAIIAVMFMVTSMIVDTMIALAEDKRP